MRNAPLERDLVRFLVAVALGVALIAGIFVQIPRDAEGDPALPPIAFEQAGIYRMEVTLLVFYGGLLLVTPAFSGLVGGRLPTEISARGAKFAGEADRSTDLAEGTIADLERTSRYLRRKMTETKLEIGRLEERIRDSR